MQTPEFQGTHLFDRLCWAKENLEGHQSDYRVVYEDSVDECAKILVPDPNWMACALEYTEQTLPIVLSMFFGRVQVQVL